MTPTSTNVRIHHHQAGPYHQHKTLYRRTPNLPCYCNNKYESIFDMFFSIHLFVQNRQCNDKKKEKKTRSTKHCQKTNDWVIRIPLKPTGPKSDTLDWKAVSVPPVTSIVFILWYPWCLSCDIHRVYLVTSMVFILWHPSCLSCDIHRVYLVTYIVFILWHPSCLSYDIHRVYLVTSIVFGFLTSIVFILWHPSCLSCDIHRVYLVTSIMFILWHPSYLSCRNSGDKSWILKEGPDCDYVNTVIPLWVRNYDRKTLQIPSWFNSFHVCSNSLSRNSWHNPQDL